MAHLNLAKCDTRATLSQLDQPPDHGQYRGMSWNVLVTRRVPPEGIELLRKSGAGVRSHDEEEPLPRAVRDGWIAGAALDVYEHEPKIDLGLLQMPNTLLLPHLGSATVETRRRMSILAAENLLAVLDGRPCPNVVNPEVL